MALSFASAEEIVAFGNPAILVRSAADRLHAEAREDERTAEPGREPRRAGTCRHPSLRDGPVRRGCLDGIGKGGAEGVRVGETLPVQSRARRAEEASSANPIIDGSAARSSLPNRLRQRSSATAARSGTWRRQRAMNGPWPHNAYGVLDRTSDLSEFHAVDDPFIRYRPPSKLGKRNSEPIHIKKGRNSIEFGIDGLG